MHVRSLRTCGECFTTDSGSVVVGVVVLFVVFAELWLLTTLCVCDIYIYILLFVYTQNFDIFVSGCIKVHLHMYERL